MNGKYQKFTEILAMHGCVEATKITRNMRLVEDLRISGDDASEMFDDVIDEFTTNFDEFVYGDYFANECSADHNYSRLSNEEPKYFISKMFHSYLLVFWKIFSSGKEYKTLTVGQLYDAIECGKWSDSN